MIAGRVLDRDGRPFAGPPTIDPSAAWHSSLRIAVRSIVADLDGKRHGRLQQPSSGASRNNGAGQPTVPAAAAAPSAAATVPPARPRPLPTTTKEPAK